MSNKTYKCLICLDSGYLATHKDDTSNVVPMLSIVEGLTDYRLAPCACQVKTIAEKLEETSTKLKSQRRTKR